MIFDYFLKNFLFVSRMKLIEEKKNLYRNISSNKEIEKYQLEKFNNIWLEAINNHPFYKKWKHKHNLPITINKIEDLRNFPILTKKDIQKSQDLIFNHLKDYSIISTGGSSGEPTKFPVSRKESNITYANHYLVRSWWGIKPYDKILLFWGHSHLFGSGIKGQFKQYKRILFDYIINTKRLNAYDMSVNTLEEYYQDLKKINPSMIIGYASTIYKIAKYIKENSLDIGIKDKLKGVVVTSETVMQYDIDLIESVFQVPCIIEYGMAETGVIANSKDSSNNIKLLWDSFIGIKSDDGDFLLTTIFKKAFPLINYRTDDVVYSQDKQSILNIDKIDGRKKDILEINSKNGKLELSGILMVHILKTYKGIYEIQFKQKTNNRVEIIFTADRKLDINHISDFFIQNIKIDHQDIDEKSFTFKQVGNISGTIAGKAKWVEKKI